MSKIVEAPNYLNVYPSSAATKVFDHASTPLPWDGVHLKPMKL
jgi:hypothetical protein